MPNVNWQFDSDTHTFHKQTAEYDLEVGRNGLLLISNGQDVIEHVAKGPASAKSDGDYFLKHGELPEPMQEIQQYQQPHFQPANYDTHPQVAIAQLDFNFRRFLVMAVCILIGFVTFASFFGYTLISYQISYGKHGTMLWVLTGSVPLSIGIALYYLFTKGFRR